jgi:hypothetical protein
VLYKQFYLAKRNPDIPAEEWPRAWRSHAKYISTEFKGAVAPIASVSYCTRVLQPTLAGAAFEPPDASREYDGVAVVASPSADAFRAAVWGISQEEWHAATGLSKADRKKVEIDELRVFSTHVANFSFRCTETFVHGGAPGQAAIIRFLCRKAGSSREQFDAALARHADIGKRAVDATNTATRYVHNLLREAPPPDYPFDGVTETWFIASDDATRAFVDDAFKPVARDLPGFCDIDRSVTMLCHVTHRWPREQDDKTKQRAG